MKKSKYLSILFIILFQVFAFTTYAQMTDPELPGGSPEDNGGGDPLGGRAPVSGGTVVLLSFAIAYGGKKIYNLINQKDNVVE